MAKARSKPQATNTKAADVERKSAEQAVRIRHVEGMRNKMTSGEDVAPMADAGFDTKGLPTIGRTHKENLLAQMKKAGVDVTRPTPGISRMNPDTQMAIGADGKPFMSSAVAKEKAKAGRGFKSIAKRVLRSSGNIISGSHQNVASRQPVEGRPETLSPPRILPKR